MSKISLIIEREYLTRVQKKSFILMTILSPIVMVALIFAPIWLAQLSSDEVRQIAIIDQTGLYKNIYENSEEYQFTYTQGILNPAEMRAEESQPYAYVIIKDNLLNNPKGMTIYSQKQITNSCESMITSQMEEFLKNEKLLSYNIPNIKQIIDDSDINLHVDTIRLEEDGSRNTNLIRNGHGYRYGHDIDYIYVSHALRRPSHVECHAGKNQPNCGSNGFIGKTF